MHEYYINYCTSAKVFLDPGVTILMHSEIKLHRELGNESNFFLSFKRIPVALGSFCTKKQKHALRGSFINSSNYIQ